MFLVFVWSFSVGRHFCVSLYRLFNNRPYTSRGCMRWAVSHSRPVPRFKYHTKVLSVRSRLKEQKQAEYTYKCEQIKWSRFTYFYNNNTFGFKVLIVKIISDRLRRTVHQHSSGKMIQWTWIRPFESYPSKTLSVPFLTMIETDTEGKPLPPTAITPHFIPKLSMGWKKPNRNAFASRLLSCIMMLEGRFPSTDTIRTMGLFFFFFWINSQLL